MPAVPVLMVLYSNDAVEVRYSDGSCLQVAPCGSTFVHHESPGETIHPAHGINIYNAALSVNFQFEDKFLKLGSKYGMFCIAKHIQKCKLSGSRQQT